MKDIKIDVKGTEIGLFTKDHNNFLSLTDIARFKNKTEPKDVIKNWIRNRGTIEFLGLWEKLNNSDFKGVEFDTFRIEAGSNHFVLSPGKWIKVTNAVGISVKSGRFGGTYAHQDIAFEFASWISAEFKLYLLKEFQRLKQNELEQKQLEWNVSRTLSKVNYEIHTRAIKENIIPKDISGLQDGFIYANEADLLNIALFSCTAKEWRENNSQKTGNIRDEATLVQLVVLSNLESLNAELIKMDIPAQDRLLKLNRIAIDQLKVLVESKPMKRLK